MAISQQQQIAIAQMARNELSRRYYKNYVVDVHFGQYQLFPHTELICNYLQRIADGEQLRIIIEMPPRHSKSMTVTETFPSYYLGRNPNKRVITSAYGDGLAKKFGRLNRNKFRENAKRIFNLDLSASNNAITDWGIDGHSGGMISTGIGGSITGQGADCFPEGTMIDTEIGKIDVKELHEMEKPPRVLSYNHKKGKLEYKEIQVTRRKKSNELTKISTASGNEIISTKEHRHYDFERGYREANLFKPGDKLTVQAVQKEHTLRCVQKEKERKRDILFRVLPFSKKENGNTRMYIVWETLRKTILRIQQSVKEGANRLLLFGRMFQKTSFLQKFKRLPLLWGYEEKRQQILQQRMYVETQKREQKENRMSSMFKNVLPAFTQNSLLFERMCKPFTFRKNEREEQQPLQKRNKLFERIFGNETYNFKERQPQMQSVSKGRTTHDNVERSKKNQPSYSSYERRCNRQHKREFDNTMCELSHHTPQIESDTVQNVKSYEQPNTIVYDLQIADNHNFFANGLLVHNCMIIDDPIKNAKEAQSKTVRDTIWDEWESTLSTRLHKGASVIVIMTRWHEDDMIGRLLDTSPYDWVRLRLPAIAEDKDDLLGREIGEPLCAELGYDKEWAAFKKEEVGSRTWASLYQQRPTVAQGNIFKRQWINYFDNKDNKYFDDMLMSWDMTFKDSEEGDYVVGQVWGKKGSEYYLVDQIREQLDFTNSLKAVENMARKYPRCRRILIEDKANGPAIINTLKRKVSGIIPITPKESKEARAFSVTPFFEAGNVYLYNKLPYLDELVDELVGFPQAAHD